MTIIKPAILNRAEGGRRGVNPAVLEELSDDETVIRAATISKGIYWKGIFLYVLSLFLLIKAFNLGVFFFVVASIITGIEYLTQHFLILVLTNKRVFMRYGIIQLDMLQFRLSKVESVEVETPPMGRLLGYGRVVITGTGSQIRAIPFVQDAGAFRHDLNEILDAIEEGKTS